MPWKPIAPIHPVTDEYEDTPMKSNVANNMNDSDAAFRSLHLVDPELLPLLSSWTNVELNSQTLVTIRETPVPIAPARPDLAARVEHERRTIKGPAGAPSVSVEIYRSREAAGARPALLHIHGGGFVAGEATWFAGPCIEIAAKLECTVVSVNYRLAPETPAPGPVEDCYAALSWMVANSRALGIDAAQIGVKGESAGGGLAALALLVRDRREHALLFQQLIYPLLDDRTGAHPDSHSYAGGFIWTPQNNQFGWRALLGHATGEDGVSPYVVPARA